MIAVSVVLGVRFLGSNGSVVVLFVVSYIVNPGVVPEVVDILIRYNDTARLGYLKGPYHLHLINIMVYVWLELEI